MRRSEARLNIACRGLAVGIASLAAASSFAQAGTPTWGKIGDLGIGMLQDAVYQQHGFGSSGEYDRDQGIRALTTRATGIGSAGPS